MRMVDGGGGGGTGSISSASPTALLAYSDAGKRIDAELETTAARLRAALATFQSTCLEYPTGVTTALADQLTAFAKRTAQDDVWVGKVAAAFLQADGMPADFVTLLGSPVSNWSVVQRLEYVMERAMMDLPGDVADRLKAMLTPENLGIMATVLGVWIASHAAGVGEVADLGLGIFGLIEIGPDVFRVGKDLWDFGSGVVHGGSQADLDNAGRKLSDAIAVGGIDTALGLLFKAVGEKLPSKPPSTAADMVTPEGFVVKVSTAEIDATTADMTVSEPPAEQSGGGTQPGELPPASTPAGKAARWDLYLERTGGEGWSYERWSRVYDLNLERARQANAAVDAFAKQLGYGEREVTVKVDGVPRRLDIADVALQIGYEYKTGYQTRTADNMSELARDAVLVQQGWSITWVFKGTASQPLLQSLEDAGISIEYNN